MAVEKPNEAGEAKAHPAIEVFQLSLYLCALCEGADGCWYHEQLDLSIQLFIELLDRVKRATRALLYSALRGMTSLKGGEQRKDKQQARPAMSWEKDVEYYFNLTSAPSFYTVGRNCALNNSTSHGIIP